MARRGDRIRRAAATGGIALLAACAIAQEPPPAGGVPQTAPATPAPDAAARATPAFRGQTANGRAFDSAELEGKVAVVCVLGVSFEPCRREAASLKGVQEERGESVRVVCIAMDRDPMLDEPLLDAMLAFARETGLPCPVIATPEMMAAWGRLLPEGTVSMYPTTFIVGRDGTVRRILKGVTAPGSLLAAVRAAEGAADASASCPVCSRPEDVCEACWQAERVCAPDADCVACKSNRDPPGEGAPDGARGPLCERHARERNACRVCGSSAPR
ncbi:MAG: TlpA family protein disulfide reductase [Planctomycetes bacterium]|nr:TlpA family protein disulfide reductase [Planctomycetota bacterium]